MQKFLIMKPRSPASKVAKNLVLDSGGKVIEKNVLGLIVRCKKSIGNHLDLIPIVHLVQIVR